MTPETEEKTPSKEQKRENVRVEVGREEVEKAMDISRALTVVWD